MGHLLCCEKFCLSKFGCMNQTESQPVRRALKNRTAWVNESGRSRGKSELDNKVLSLCLSIKLGTMAKPEVELRDNGLDKHYYLNRSPPPQFTRGQILWLGSDSPYKNHHNNYTITLPDKVWQAQLQRCVSILLFQGKRRNKYHAKEWI